MNNCTVCDDCFRNDNRNKVICDGYCRQAFHAECINFNKEALLHYREIPNLQWLCDTCIIQMRSSNVSFVSSSTPRFNKLNFTSFARTSSPSYVRSSITAANRKRKPIRSAKPAKSSESLVNTFLTVNRYNNNAIDFCSPSSKHKMPHHILKTPDASKSHPPNISAINPTDVAYCKPKHIEDSQLESEKCSVKYAGANRSHPPTKSVTNQTDAALSKPKRTEDLEVESENQMVKSPNVNESHPPTAIAINQPDVAQPSSFADVLTKSSIAQTAPDEVTDVIVKPQSDSSQSRRILSPPSETRKVAYVSRVYRETTEEEMVDYLITKNAITSADDVSCTKLISPNVDLNTVSFVSFKISGSSEVFRLITEDKFWPDNIIVREFVNR